MALFDPNGFPIVLADALARRMQTVDQRVGKLVTLLVRQLFTAKLPLKHKYPTMREMIVAHLFFLMRHRGPVEWVFTGHDRSDPGLLACNPFRMKIFVVELAEKSPFASTFCGE